MRTFFGIDRSELDRKRLWLEGVVIGIAAAVFATGLIMLVTRLVECLKIRTPHFLTAIEFAGGIEPGDYVKIDFDCSFDTLKYDNSKMYTLRLAGRNEYVYSEDPDPKQGYWYYRDYGFFDDPMDSAGYTPTQPYSVIARAVYDRSRLSWFRYKLENPEEFLGTITYSVPNTVENTLFDFYFDRINVGKVRATAYLWLVVTVIGAVGTVTAVKWAVNDQQRHIYFSRFEKDNEKARVAMEEYYTDKRKSPEHRRRLK